MTNESQQRTVRFDLHEQLNDIIQYLSHVDLPPDHELDVKTQDVRSVVRALSETTATSTAFSTMSLNSIRARIIHHYVDILNVNKVQEFTIDLREILENQFGSQNIDNINWVSFIEILDFTTLTQGPISRLVSDDDYRVDKRLYINPIPDPVPNRFYPDLGESNYCRYFIERTKTDKTSLTLKLGPQGLDKPTLDQSTKIDNSQQRTYVSYRVHIKAALSKNFEIMDNKHVSVSSK